MWPIVKLTALAPPKSGNIMKSIHHEGYRGLVNELRQARLRAGLTQAEAGQLLGRSRQWLHKAETSELRLDIFQLAQLCHIYGLKAHNLVRRLEEGVP